MVIYSLNSSIWQQYVIFTNGLAPILIFLMAIIKASIVIKDIIGVMVIRRWIVMMYRCMGRCIDRCMRSHCVSNAQN